ncbi:MAG TPA: Ppx/GppA phosphatase family protein [Alphaproteobacteria bacterium]|jgi:exopolyphosphatase/guanosine-5'-triphosphate,3'-diphosphate pyrophosphatase
MDSAAAPSEYGAQPGSGARTYAALDLGTNNCRLLIAAPQGAGFRVIESFSRIVRLGEGLTASGRLAPRAMGRAIEALRICGGRLSRYKGLHLRAVATEACRQAANGHEFVARVKRETGLALEIINAEEEARLALAGCASLLDESAPHAFVFDIGGGSTELIWRRDIRPRGGMNGHGLGRGIGAEMLAQGLDGLRFHSVPIGVVTMAESYGADRVAPAAYKAMVDQALGLLRPFETAEQIGGEIAGARVQMLGTSGTVTTLASVFLNLRRYSRMRVDGSYLDFDAIRRISDEVAGLDYAGRAAMPCIGPQRADLVVGGVAILDAICRLWPVGRLRVADRGLREGILNLLIAADRASGAPAAAA